jgi:hypothetical protein
LVTWAWHVDEKQMKRSLGAGWPDVFVKKSPKDNKKSPKKSPKHIFLSFSIKNCFMVFSVWFYANIQWHWTFFYSFFYIKKEIKFSEYFWKTCKKPLFKQNFSLIKVNFGLFFHGYNFAQIIGLLFLEKKFAQHHKKSPKWQNFAQSGHPGRWGR